MTAKRYTYNVNKNTIECDEKFVAYVNSVDGFRIANKMNVLQKENEQLKQSFKEILKDLEVSTFNKELLEKENEELKEHFIYLIGTALEDKECRKIYAKGLLEIFDDCANLDEAKSKIKEYLE